MSSGASSPASMNVFVMRGIGGCWNDSRRPLPVNPVPRSRALSRSCMYPRSTPFSMRTVRLVGVPSSSTLSEPRRLGMVPSSTTVTRSEATRSPTRPVNADTPFRLKSPSRPWPIASWSRMPGHPGPSTTVIVPAGAATAPSFTRAWRAASFANRAQRSPSMK